jgi:hypothetical protein
MISYGVSIVFDALKDMWICLNIFPQTKECSFCMVLCKQIERSFGYFGSGPIVEGEEYFALESMHRPEQV